MCFQAIPPATPLVKDGKLRALAVTAAKRSPALPDVPTLDELGIKDQEAETMQGVLVPAGTPQPIVDLLQSEIARIVALPDVQARLRRDGFIAQPMSPADFTKFVEDENKRWKPLIEAAGLAGKGG